MSPLEQHYPFTLPPLPYAYDALEPELDGNTLFVHHDVHFSACVDALNRLLERTPACQSWPLRKLCLDWESLPDDLRQDIRSSAGEVLGHDLYFRALRPLPASAPAPPLEGALTRDFGGMAELKAAMRQAVLGRSDWVWLAADRVGRLSVRRTPHQDTPLPLVPLLCCDAREHAYCLQYRNRRADYFEAWWRLVDWAQISRSYAGMLGRRPPRPLF